MSLRTKTLLLFFAFVLLPLVALGAVYSVGTRVAVEQVAREELEELTRSVADRLERDLASARTELRRLAGAANTGSLMQGALQSDSVEGFVEELLTSSPILRDLLHSVELRGPSGSVITNVALSNPVSDDGWLCDVGPSPLLAEIEIPLELNGGPALALVGQVSARALLAPVQMLRPGSQRGGTVLVDRTNETLRLADCGNGAPAPWIIAEATGSGESAASGAGSPGTFAKRDGLLAAFVPLEQPRWTLVSTASSEEALAPLARLRLVYVALALLVGAAATLGFRLVTGGLFRAFDELRLAFQKIGMGDFAPWLPPRQDEVGGLSLALREMAERLRHMMRSLEQNGRLAVVGEMAAQMAHEIRTPLSSIKMNLQRIQRNAGTAELPADTKVSIDTSLREIARLEAAVTRVLDLTSGRATSRRRCSLHALVADSVNLLRGALESHGISVRPSLAAESDWIRVDVDEVKGALLSLLVNAVEATPRGGEISVGTQLFLGEEGKQMVAVAVSDTGPGVPLALREEIFHPFFTTKREGNGMGLPAALRTVREHGGDLFLSERPDGRGGACFVVLFPLIRADLAEDVEAFIRDPAADPWMSGGNGSGSSWRAPRQAQVFQEARANTGAASTQRWLAPVNTSVVVPVPSPRIPRPKS